MDLTPLYELRERLKTSAIAGTALLADDFRLKRAIENFAPLAQASPIFGKVAQLAQAALAPDCADRPGALLGRADTDGCGALHAGRHRCDWRTDAPIGSRLGQRR